MVAAQETTFGSNGSPCKMEQHMATVSLPEHASAVRASLHSIFERLETRNEQQLMQTAVPCARMADFQAVLSELPMDCAQAEQASLFHLATSLGAEMHNSAATAAQTAIRVAERYMDVLFTDLQDLHEKLQLETKQHEFAVEHASRVSKFVKELSKGVKSSQMQNDLVELEELEKQTQDEMQHSDPHNADLISKIEALEKKAVDAQVATLAWRIETAEAASKQAVLDAAKLRTSVESKFDEYNFKADALAARIEAAGKWIEDVANISLPSMSTRESELAANTSPSAHAVESRANASAASEQVTQHKPMAKHEVDAMEASITARIDAMSSATSDMCGEILAECMANLSAVDRRVNSAEERFDGTAAELRKEMRDGLRPFTEDTRLEHRVSMLEAQTKHNATMMTFLLKGTATSSQNDIDVVEVEVTQHRSKDASNCRGLEEDAMAQMDSSMPGRSMVQQAEGDLQASAQTCASLCALVPSRQKPSPDPGTDLKDRLKGLMSAVSEALCDDSIKEVQRITDGYCAPAMQLQETGHMMRQKKALDEKQPGSKSCTNLARPGSFEKHSPVQAHKSLKLHDGMCGSEKAPSTYCGSWSAPMPVRTVISPVVRSASPCGPTSCSSPHIVINGRACSPPTPAISELQVLSCSRSRHPVVVSSPGPFDFRMTQVEKPTPHSIATGSPMPAMTHKPRIFERRANAESSKGYSCPSLLVANTKPGASPVTAMKDCRTQSRGGLLTT